MFGGVPLSTVGLASRICNENYDESTIPLCGRPEGRTCMF
jgi:hypothetical protein